MKIKILGTSNGIIADGYAECLGRLDDVEVVANVSLGSSHPCLVPLMLENDVDTPADVFVLDVCINEQRAMAKRLYEPRLSEYALDHFTTHCASTGVRPLVLLLPTCVDEKIIRTTTDRWQRYCQARGLPYIDVAAMADDAVRAGDAMVDLWRDQHHPSPEFSHRIAERIAESARETAACDVATAIHSGVLEVVRCSTGHEIHRSTRVANRQFRRLADGESFSVERDGEFEVVGISLNMAQTHGALEIAGRNTTVQRLDNGYYNPKRSLWYVVWSLVEPVQSIDGVVTVTVRQSKEHSGQKKNDHIVAGSPTDQVSPVVEIEGLIVRRLY